MVLPVDIIFYHHELYGKRGESRANLIRWPSWQTRYNPYHLTAAASLTESFLEIAERFEADNPGVELDFNFAGSQQLSQQLIQGASADLFASTDEEYMNSLVEVGIIANGNQHEIAANRLAVIFRKDSRVPIYQLEDLASPGLHLVVGAESVPVGKHSLEFLELASQDEGYGRFFKDNVVRNIMSYEENVKAVLSKVILGPAQWLESIVGPHGMSSRGRPQVFSSVVMARSKSARRRPG